MSSGQLSFFSAGAQPASVDDLEGLLCGPGQVVRQGDVARVSVIVRDEWRVASLLAALDALGLGGGTADAHEEGGTTVRTPFDARLVPLAEHWSGGCRWICSGCRHLLKKWKPSPQTRAAMLTNDWWSGCWLRRTLANVGDGIGWTWPATRIATVTRKTVPVRQLGFTGTG